MNTPKVVLDTNVIISAFLTPSGIPDFILSEVESGHMASYYCDEIYDEYKEVLGRPKFSKISKEADALLAAMPGCFIGIFPEASDIPFEDESDRPFFDTAATANATLVTGNIKHFPESPYVCTPSEFARAYINLKLKHAALAGRGNGRG
jgi:putative PIN family toxin of toxin-antitoxin system